MKLTAYDLDRKSPAALIAARRRPTGRTPMPAAERTRRREIARQALGAFPSMSGARSPLPPAAGQDPSSSTFRRMSHMANTTSTSAISGSIPKP